MLIDGSDNANIKEAASLLRQGLLVAFPTETVYGLGANASDPQALERLYAAKGRPASHPVIVHIASADKLAHWVAYVPESAGKLAKAFWPGPLTIVLPCAEHVLPQVTGGQATVGLRVPNHPVALSLLQEFGGGIAAPSANKFGRLSPTRAEHVVTEFGNEVEVVLDGGPCKVGIESTIVNLCGTQPQILRPGIISKSEIEHALQERRSNDQERTESGELGTEQVRAPGGLPIHYAPLTPLKLVSSSDLPSELNDTKRNEKAVLSFRKPYADFDVASWIVAPLDPELYARNLYTNVRTLDQLGKKVIVVEDVPNDERWFAVHDRLIRAASKLCFY